MRKDDYSLYYARFHDDTEAHAIEMERHFTGILRSDLPDDRSSAIVDVGCGFGFALRAMRSLGYTRIRGLEESPEQAERCSRAGFDVEVCDDTIAWLRGRPAAFDCVVLLDVLEHVPKHEQIEFLAAIREALRPGGRIVLTTPNANAILASRWRYNDHTHHTSFTEHSLHYVLANARFEPIRMQAPKGIGPFPGPLWRRSTWPGVRRWLVRWCWLQVFKAEMPWENLDEISFELNLQAVAFRPA